MSNVASTIQGVFALAAIIAGALSGSMTRAAIWGVAVGCLPAALLIAAVVSAGAQNLDTARFVGYLAGTVGACAVAALIGYGLKRLFRRRPQAAPNA